MLRFIEFRLTKQGEETASWEAMREIQGKSRRQVMKQLADEDKTADIASPQRKVRIKE